MSEQEIIPVSTFTGSKCKGMLLKHKRTPNMKGTVFLSESLLYGMHLNIKSRGLEKLGSYSGDRKTDGQCDGESRILRTIPRDKQYKAG